MLLKPAAASLPALAMMLRSGSRGLFYIAKPYLLLLDIPPTSRLSNNLRAASAVLRPINVIASEAKQSILSLLGEHGLLRYACNDVVAI
jgi:hypothetical protein